MNVNKLPQPSPQSAQRAYVSPLLPSTPLYKATATNTGNTATPIIPLNIFAAPVNAGKDGELVFETVGDVGPAVPLGTVVLLKLVQAQTMLHRKTHLFPAPQTLIVRLTLEVISTANNPAVASVVLTSSSSFSAAVPTVYLIVASPDVSVVAELMSTPPTFLSAMLKGCSVVMAVMVKLSTSAAMASYWNVLGRLAAVAPSSSPEGGGGCHLCLSCRCRRGRESGRGRRSSPVQRRCQ